MLKFKSKLVDFGKIALPNPEEITQNFRLRFFAFPQLVLVENKTLKF
jgi:hypothetical protein